MLGKLPGGCRSDFRENRQGIATANETDPAAIPANLVAGIAAATIVPAIIRHIKPATAAARTVSSSISSSAVRTMPAFDGVKQALR